MGNDSAKDLWGQIFGKMAKEACATVVDPSHDVIQDETRLRAALRHAGWPAALIESQLAFHRADASAAPVTSPGVNPHVEAHLARLCDEVKETMDVLGFASHTQVARGVEPRTVPFASLINVIMTDESILTVGAFLFRFCGLVARAFTRTLMIDPYAWEAQSLAGKVPPGLMAKRPDVLGYWIRIFISFAATGTHILVPFRPATPKELLLFEQVARAMELFAIAHEYGHHHFKHGREMGDDPILHEFEADRFAVRITYELEKVPLIAPNPYLSSGAGAVVLLRALTILREVRGALETQPEVSAETHPTVEDRTARLDTALTMVAEDYIRQRNFRLVAGNIMDVVATSIATALKALTPELRKSLGQLTEAT